MSEPLKFQVQLVEKELAHVEIVEKELLKVNLNTIDIIPKVLKSEEVLALFSLNETPSNVNTLPSKRFKSASGFISETLQVFLNGQKVHTSEITIHSNQEFSYPIDIISDDKVEINYFKV